MHKSFMFYISLMGMVAALLLVKHLRTEVPPSVPLGIPASSPFAASIGGQGIIESVEENVKVAAPGPGLVSQVLVKVGDRVERGAPLFLLDSREAASQVRVQEAQLPSLDARVREAEALLADRSDQSSRSLALAVRRCISAEEGQKARSAVDIAVAQLQRSRADLQYARAQLEQSRVRLDLLIVKAPRSGTVLQVNVRPGEYASAQAPEPPVLLGETEQLQLRADIDEDSAESVNPGCQAYAYLKGRRSVQIPLHFVRIEPYIVPKKSLTGASSERVDTRVLQVIFRFERPGIPLYVGQQMDVFLESKVESPAGNTPKTRG